MKKEDNTAHFDLVKQQNKRVIRNLLRSKQSLSVSELSKMSGLSYPTVSTLLKNLEEEKQVLVSRKTESCGGRPGIRYEFNTEFQYALIMHFAELQLFCDIYDASGQLVRTVPYPCSYQITPEEFCSIVRDMKQKYDAITAIAVGIPGTMYQDTITHLPMYPNLIGSELGDRLKNEFHAQLYIENDINAISYCEIGEFQDFAHVVFMNRCIGVGIVLNRQVIKGTRGYAGEFQYLVKNDKKTEKVLAECILTLISVLDLEHFLISSDSAEELSPADIMTTLADILPAARLPQLHVVTVEELDRRYTKGLLLRVLNQWEEEN